MGAKDSVRHVEGWWLWCRHCALNHLPKEDTSQFQHMWMISHKKAQHLKHFIDYAAPKTCPDTPVCHHFMDTPDCVCKSSTPFGVKGDRCDSQGVLADPKVLNDFNFGWARALGM